MIINIKKPFNHTNRIILKNLIFISYKSHKNIKLNFIYLSHSQYEARFFL